jgi:hypothetical protein
MLFPRLGLQACPTPKGNFIHYFCTPGCFDWDPPMRSDMEFSIYCIMSALKSLEFWSIWDFQIRDAQYVLDRDFLCVCVCCWGWNSGHGAW